MATKRKDFTQIAFDVAQRAIGEVTAPAPSKKQASGRKGGLVGGAVRASTLSAEERSAIAKKAARARWGARSSKQGT